MKTLAFLLAALLAQGEAAPPPPTSMYDGPCYWVLSMISHPPNPTQYLPSCDADGNFSVMQCWKAIEVCWCVDPKTGCEVSGTKVHGERPDCTVHTRREEEHGDDHDDDHYHKDDHEHEDDHEHDDDHYHKDDHEVEHEYKHEYKHEYEPMPEPMPEPDKKSSCHEGWTPFYDHCYIFIDSPKCWVKAELYCQYMDANLASITCSQTNHFLQGLSKADTHDFPETWVGANNAVQACSWFWSDGSKFDYEDWYSDMYKTREDSCLKINYGYQNKWGAAGCNDTLPFICSKPIQHWVPMIHDEIPPEIYH
ncbi:unnamed protein product [Knipowitschia caucasica]|uniref:C-type lectin domain-containing protein n=1 Tax=Knipowitschia caucasica TaxID=637954 RepID=A0AAV2KSC1_KNICA